MFRLLLKHFFRGFFDNDWITRDENLGTTLAQVFGLLAAPGLVIPMLLIPVYGVPGRLPPFEFERMRLSHECFFISLSMLVMGFVSVVEWDALFPDARDYRILTPLPVPLRTVFAAKFVALFLFLALFAVIVNGAAPFLYPPVALSGRSGASSLTEAASFGLAQAAAQYSATAFMFFFFVSLQGALMNLLGWRWFKRVSQAVQLGALVALLCGFFVFDKMVSQLRLYSTGTPVSVWFYPPAWFLGLFERLLGNSSPLFGSLAGVALAALGLAVGAAAVTYLLTYRRYVGRSLENAASLPVEPGFLERAWSAVVNRMAGSDPLELASYHFIAKTLGRSRRHRLVLAAYAGIGFALVLDSVSVVLTRLGQDATARPTPALLSVQLVLCFFLLVGIRFAFTIPAELRANWVFRLADTQQGSGHLAGARKALVLFGAIPTLLILFPTQGVLWGWKIAALHLLYGFVLALVLAEVLLFGFCKIPFTCSYLPGKANIRSRWPLYWILFGAYAYGMARLEYALLLEPQKLVLFCVLILAACAAWARWRGHRRERGFAFVFLDEPEPEVLTLNLTP